jgi:hypothetical protein
MSPHTCPSRRPGMSVRRAPVRIAETLAMFERGQRRQWTGSGIAIVNAPTLVEMEEDG